MTSEIPESMGFAEASVFPLAVATPGVALFKKRSLGLPFPTVEERKETGKVLLDWGASSLWEVMPFRWQERPEWRSLQRARLEILRM